MANIDIFLFDLRIFGQILSWRAFLHFLNIFPENFSPSMFKRRVGVGVKGFLNNVKKKLHFGLTKASLAPVSFVIFCWCFLWECFIIRIVGIVRIVRIVGIVGIAHKIFWFCAACKALSFPFHWFVWLPTFSLIIHITELLFGAYSHWVCIHMDY